MLAGMDTEEVTYQMALDIVESEESRARRAGVPTVAETMATPPARRVSAKDPDWFAKLERFAAR